MRKGEVKKIGNITQPASNNNERHSPNGKFGGVEIEPPNYNSNYNSNNNSPSRRPRRPKRLRGRPSVGRRG